MDPEFRDGAQPEWPNCVLFSIPRKLCRWCLNSASLLMWKGTEGNRHQGPETQGLRDSHIQGLRDPGTQALRDPNN